MVRSMYSGVAGMKAHQIKMDAIGNNIANVNTYGFKSSSVAFSDVYYQSMKTASAGSGNRGGTNPAQIGYGSMLSTISVNQGTSTMQNTGRSMDVAITGEGFFQVQDSEGNTFYTKAGSTKIDGAGNLVDSNGNFILGVSGNPFGKPAGSSRIQLSVPSVNPAPGSAESTINDKKIKISATNNTADSNVAFNFESSTSMPIGQKVEAFLTSSGVTIRLNANEKFTSLAVLEQEINNAITAANGGTAHPGGNFSLSLSDSAAFSAAGPDGLSGAEIAGTNYGVKPGKVEVPTAWKNIFTVSGVGEKFLDGVATLAPPEYTITKNAAGTGTPVLSEDEFVFEIDINGNTYTGTVKASQMTNSGSLLLKKTAPAAGGTGDTITITYPSQTAMESALGGAGPWTDTTLTNNPVASEPSLDLGFGSEPFKLTGGTEGGAQTVEDLTGIAVSSDGVIVGNHAIHGLMELGRIDLVTFANPGGLMQAGNTYFQQSSNSGTPTRAKPGENGTGALAGGSLEMSNVDLSNEFADMITTQRGFQANSRLITVSDTLLEELINLKR